ncbi:small GTP-binding protein, putative [Trichomonas vaginalis G3]|uniref:Small GTP-binding protein, putative n=1 Tax=Trichomonas vaginalis (strain ATCC PRA-98 / G3) TaxID=412133 RepID=A2GDY7_TRIV3|nr:GTPase protein [Trichomonas vaginalis G3]EAX84628.1 small GTP-binding protein, putative [Trichomonas vaginalis G3]KAI5535914.1 GTPase protein [Trichomonas vaginalis G3]|eukprot:XP_001297558.1 small GTP-binding protein [Trichomonas vaginalis G3]
MIGDAGVGKTALVRRLITDEFDGVLDSTIGVEYSLYKLSIGNQKIQLQIWDTAGQEQYRALSQAYYRDAVGVLIVFSYNNHHSFEGLEDWIVDVRNYCHPKAKILLVGNKIDLESERTVSKAEIEQFSNNNRLEYIETSAKTNANVTEAFHKAARNVFQSVVTKEIQIGIQPTLYAPKKKEEKTGCC